MKFPLQVEQVLNQVAEPEYREMLVEVLSLMSKLDILLKTDNPVIPLDKPFDVDSVVHVANRIFIEHNVSCLLIEYCGCI